MGTKSVGVEFINVGPQTKRGGWKAVEAKFTGMLKSGKLGLYHSSYNVIDCLLAPFALLRALRQHLHVSGEGALKLRFEVPR